MAVKVFIYLAEKDENLIIELAHKSEKITDFVRNLIEIFVVIKENDREIFYDSENINQFFSIIKNLVEDKIYLENPLSALRSKLGKTAKNIRDSLFSHLQSNHFIIWNFDKFSIDYAHLLLKELTERIICYPKELYLLVNIGDDFQTNRHFLTIFKDGLQGENLPNNFIKIPFVSDVEELRLWIATHHVKSFSLLDKSRFKKTNYIQQGKPVYEEFATGHFWYLDNFHKNEYEVFDSQKQHIGVADLEGNLDAIKAVAGRTF